MLTKTDVDKITATSQELEAFGKRFGWELCSFNPGAIFATSIGDRVLFNDTELKEVQRATKISYNLGLEEAADMIRVITTKGTACHLAEAILRAKISIDT